MEVDYYSKYLKYKSKYLELKAQLGSGVGKCKTCSCRSFQGRVDPKLSDDLKAKLVCKTYGCSHPYSAHGDTAITLNRAMYKEMAGLK